MRDRTVRTLDDLIILFLNHTESRVPAEISPATARAYEARIRHAHTLGRVRLSDLQSQHLQRWCHRLGPKAPSVRASVATLVQVLRWGRREGYMHHAPELGLLRPLRRAQLPRPFNDKELQQFVQACRDEQLERGGIFDPLTRARETAVSAILEAHCLCGTRQGELRTAKVEAFDRDDRTLLVHGKRGFRRVPTSAPLFQLLSERQRLVAGRHSFLFPGIKAGPITDSAVYKGFQRVGGSLARGRHPHDLRHTFVRVARRRGASWQQIADALGHADVQTTINVYGRFDDVNPDSRDVADLVGDIVGTGVSL